MSTPIRNIELVVVLAGIEFTHEGHLGQKEARLIQEILDQAGIRYRKTVQKKKLRFFTRDVTVINEKVLKLSTTYSPTIHEAVNEAIPWAGKVGKTIQFTFKGITIKVNGDSLNNLILRDYYRSIARILPLNEVGPYPKMDLTEEEAADLHVYLMIGL